MDKKYVKIITRILIGSFLIILEFVMYNYADFLIKNQLIILLVTFYIGRISFADIDQEDLVSNQIISVFLGILYGFFTMSNPAMYALFFYAVATFMTKYARKDNLYISYFYVTGMYFIFFVLRVMYMTLMHDVAFDVVDIVVKNILIITLINATLCYVISIYKALNESRLKERKKN